MQSPVKGSQSCNSKCQTSPASIKRLACSGSATLMTSGPVVRLNRRSFFEKATHRISTDPRSPGFCLYISSIALPCTWSTRIPCATTANSLFFTLAPSPNTDSQLWLASQLVRARSLSIASTMSPLGSLRTATASPAIFFLFTCSMISLYVRFFCGFVSLPRTAMISRL